MFKTFEDILKFVVCLYVLMSIHFTPSDGEHSKRVSDRKSSNFKCSIKTGKEHRKWPSEFDVCSGSPPHQTDSDG
ncbi:hypothetical protein CEXT_160601 [Caerostris extrusa]|uniref:Uncharacterized protein n=1 Tax=Caerostris extrusa TaxID=172846 RepID=A0AAV4YD52_CAEEX|nr:hypothetical protein CEXT_160601 [Caerostris extrusa]